MASHPYCPQCGSPIDPATQICDAGHHVTSEHMIGVASTIENANLEIEPRPSAHAEATEADSLTGKKFGKFAIVGLLGRGGMGAVYRGRHEELGHYAAIKVIDRKLVGSQDVITRLFREARAAAQIGHVNIVQVFDFGRDPDIGGYIVMELLKGAPLEQELATEGRFDERRICAIALEICAALAAAHAKGIVHRDLKPGNVFLQKTASGELVKVMDFGIAKVAETLGESATQPGTILGTPRYMSPEQWGSESVDARSDVYSLGVMLYRMATGSLPNPKATSLPQLARAVGQKIQPAPRAVAPDVSEALEAIIYKCCEPTKEDRYQSMDEVAEAIRTIHGGAPVRAAKRATSTLRNGVIAAAVAVFAISAVLAFRSREAPRTTGTTASSVAAPSHPATANEIPSGLPPASAAPGPPQAPTTTEAPADPHDAGATAHATSAVSAHLPAKPPAVVSPPARPPTKPGASARPKDLLFGD